MKILIILLISIIVLNALSSVHSFSFYKTFKAKPDAESRYKAKLFLISAVVKMLEAAVITVAVKQLS